MSSNQRSGDTPFVFSHRPDLSALPPPARGYEVDLHGGFAVDKRAGYGEIYYGMPGCGIMRIDADLQRQHVIDLPVALAPLNFHSTKIGTFEGARRLFLPANNDEMVVVLTLDGQVDFVLPRPIFDEYQASDTPYRPTDTVLVDEQLYIADGYGSNYITAVNLRTRQWSGIFGGATADPHENGKFATAHGINLNPTHAHLDICDRPHARVQVHGRDGRFLASHGLPAGAYLCGIDYAEYAGRWLAVIGCLRDPVEGRPAPVYIIDARTYELLSTIRPKEDLGIEPAQHLHNVVFQVHGDDLYLVCQAWNPGHYFVLQKV